jgi:hypothetical protein
MQVNYVYNEYEFPDLFVLTICATFYQMVQQIEGCFIQWFVILQMTYLFRILQDGTNRGT